MIVAPKSPLIERWFRAYNRRYLHRSFHRVHLDGDLSALRGDGATPLILCLNHSSWWDLLLGIFLAEHLPEWSLYAPMDERQLRRYRFFARIGVIGVDRTTLQGAREFIDHACALLEGRSNGLCVTPQGEITSSQLRPVRFQPGIGVIAQELMAFYTGTVVFHYEFWAEKTPEAFISVRPIERIEVGPCFDRRTFVHDMERRMERHIDALLATCARRDPSLFQPMLRSGAAISPTYDAIRRIGARLRGEQFHDRHEDVTTPRWRDRRNRL